MNILPFVSDDTQRRVVVYNITPCSVSVEIMATSREHAPDTITVVIEAFDHCILASDVYITDVMRNLEYLGVLRIVELDSSGMSLWNDDGIGGGGGGSGGGGGGSNPPSQTSVARTAGSTGVIQPVTRAVAALVGNVDVTLPGNDAFIVPFSIGCHPPGDYEVAYITGAVNYDVGNAGNTTPWVGPSWGTTIVTRVYYAGGTVDFTGGQRYANSAAAVAGNAGAKVSFRHAGGQIAMQFRDTVNDPAQSYNDLANPPFLYKLRMLTETPGDDQDPMPVITSPTTVTYYPDTPFGYQIRATQVATSFTATDLPGNLSVDVGGFVSGYCYPDTITVTLNDVQLCANGIPVNRVGSGTAPYKSVVVQWGSYNPNASVALTKVSAGVWQAAVGNISVTSYVGPDATGGVYSTYNGPVYYRVTKESGGSFRIAVGHDAITSESSGVRSRAASVFTTMAGWLYITPNNNTVYELTPATPGTPTLEWDKLAIGGTVTVQAHATFNISASTACSTSARAGVYINMDTRLSYPAGGALIQRWIGVWSGQPQGIGYLSSPYMLSSVLTVPVPKTRMKLTVYLAAERINYVGCTPIVGTIAKNGTGTPAGYDQYWVEHRRGGTLLAKYYLNYAPTTTVAGNVIVSQTEIACSPGDTMIFQTASMDGVSGKATEDNSRDGIIFQPIPNHIGRWEAGVVVYADFIVPEI